MKRTIFGLIFIIFIISISAHLYFQHIFVPIQLKEILNTELANWLGRKVTVGETSYAPLKGIVIKDVVIDQKGYDEGTFIRANEVYLRIPLLTSIKNRALTISNINFVKPQITVIHHKNNRWNFSDLLEKNRSSASAKPLLPFRINKIQMSSAILSFEDQESADKFHSTFSDLNVDLLF